MRLLGVVRDRDRDEHGELPESHVRALVRREFGVEYGDSAWFATYRLHHRLAARFRDGPCFLVGDAAHIHSPVGAQGMNTGLQEAHNLACAFADVLVGGMPDARLDRYEAERRPVGRILVATTDRAFARRDRRTRGSPDSSAGASCRASARSPCGWCRGWSAAGACSATSRRRASAIGCRMRLARPATTSSGVRLPWTGGNYDVLRSMQWQVHGYGVPERGGATHRRGARRGGARVPTRPASAARVDRVYLVRRDGFVVAEVVSPGTGRLLDAARRRLAGE